MFGSKKEITHSAATSQERQKNWKTIEKGMIFSQCYLMLSEYFTKSCLTCQEENMAFKQLISQMRKLRPRTETGISPELGTWEFIMSFILEALIMKVGPQESGVRVGKTPPNKCPYVFAPPVLT